MFSFDEGLAKYISAVSSFPELTEDDERKATQEELIHSHLGLAVHIAKKYAKSADELADRVQDANLGLCQAALAFDPERGRFSTCAALYVRAAIRNRLTDRFGKPLRDRKRCDATRESWDTAGHESSYDHFGTVDEQLDVSQVVKRLTSSQRMVLLGRLRGATLQQLAHQRGTSHQAVRTLEQQAIKEAARHACC